MCAEYYLSHAPQADAGRQRLVLGGLKGRGAVHDADAARPRKHQEQHEEPHQGGLHTQPCRLTGCRGCTQRTRKSPSGDMRCCWLSCTLDSVCQMSTAPRPPTRDTKLSVKMVPTASHPAATNSWRPSSGLPALSTAPTDVHRGITLTCAVISMRDAGGSADHQHGPASECCAWPLTHRLTGEKGA